MSELTRRKALLAAAAGTTGACSKASTQADSVDPRAGSGQAHPVPVDPKQSGSTQAIGNASAVLGLTPLPMGAPWPVADPFLFCVHHDDHYPEGNEALGPKASLAGRQLGQDFAGKDGWNMYHGRVVPGFPQHPHRGFETVTVVRQGLLDHSDSMGATARYGQGDVQWLTAGAGIQHAEMFPLLESHQNNRLELFQIWLNLPRTSKFAEPHFSMLWSSSIPTLEHRDAARRLTQITLHAGHLGEKQAPTPPPASWAANPAHHVAIWTLKLSPHAVYSLPGTAVGVNRALYYFLGGSMKIGGEHVPARMRVELRAEANVLLENGPEPSELLLLQGRPIGEPVAQRGPFVMNTHAQIREAYLDYQRTGFGGWPWADAAPVHPRDAGRFARRPDGSLEEPG